MSPSLTHDNITLFVTIFSIGLDVFFFKDPLFRQEKKSYICPYNPFVLTTLSSSELFRVTEQ